jgi:hypothetical protein
LNIGNWITGTAGAITVPGSLTTAGFTSTGIDDNATSTAITIDSYRLHGSAATTSELLDDYEEGTWTPTGLKGQSICQLVQPLFAAAE